MRFFARRSPCARALPWILAALFAVPQGGRLLLCIEADGRVHVEGAGAGHAGRAAEVCCDVTLTAASAFALSAAPSVAGEAFADAGGKPCGPCRDVVASAIPGRAVNLRSAAASALHLPASGAHSDLACPAADLDRFPLSICLPSSPILVSLETTFIRC
jgi:hypothetical protein